MKKLNVLLILLALCGLVISQANVDVKDQPTLFKWLQGFRFTLKPEAVTVASSGDASPAVYQLTTPTKAQYQFTCSDTDGCRIQLGETGVSDGEILEIINVGGSNNVTMNDEAGVAELSAAITLGANDTLTLRYNGAAWVQVSTSNN
jgi:hypothetical protein